VKFQYRTQVNHFSHSAESLEHILNYTWLIRFT
ncbi:MAG: hypothetical protein ACI9UD_002091, partial [Glaciecola sp.]